MRPELIAWLVLLETDLINKKGKINWQFTSR